MTEFKTGDRVKFSGAQSQTAPWRTGNEGTVTNEWFSVGSGERLGYFVIWDGHEDEYRHNSAHLTKVEPVSWLSFVGPRPEPVPPTPKVVLPFHAVGGRVKDDNGNGISSFYGGLTSDKEDKDLAALVATLLNKHFGVE